MINTLYSNSTPKKDQDDPMDEDREDEDEDEEEDSDDVGLLID
jgi:hypothetical protein